jgi:hypothetical protein
MEKQSSSPPPGNPFVETASGHSCSWAKPIPLARLLAALALSLGMSSPAKAVDGCLVLLCFAAPSWRAIAQCVPPIQEVLRDLARGRPFPNCGMSGSGNSANHRRSSVPAFCPAQYIDAVILESSSDYYCRFDGAVSVTINGSLWSRTWWSFRGDTVTEFTPEAKASLGTWDTRFDGDLAAWLAAQPPAPPSMCPPSC